VRDISLKINPETHQKKKNKKIKRRHKKKKGKNHKDEWVSEVPPGMGPWKDESPTLNKEEGEI
jgi:hypothetical protein